MRLHVGFGGHLRNLLVAVASILWVCPFVLSGQAAFRRMSKLAIDVQNSLWPGTTPSETYFDVALYLYEAGAILLAVTLFVWMCIVTYRLWPTQDASP
jgi:hypothetical protein